MFLVELAQVTCKQWSQRLDIGILGMECILTVL